MMTVDTACRRYLQIHALERTVRLTEESIEQVQKEIDEAGERLSELRSTKSKMLKEIREAARDEGQLPLFDVPATLSVTKAGHETEVLRG